MQKEKLQSQHTLRSVMRGETPKGLGRSRCYAKCVHLETVKRKGVTPADSVFTDSQPPAETDGFSP